MTNKNYCTMSPDGNWSECCKRHDRRYSNRRLTRYQADVLLYRCIDKKTNCMLLAGIYFVGVRLFGWLHYKS